MSTTKTIKHSTLGVKQEMASTHVLHKIQVGLEKNKNANLKTKLKFVANTWINNTFEEKTRTKMSISMPKRIKSRWHINIYANIPTKQIIGNIKINDNLQVTHCTEKKSIKKELEQYCVEKKAYTGSYLKIKNQKFYCQDSITKCQKLENLSIECLITDPPYNISSPYATEKQIPRRLRKSGSDFIMPKGEFGKWDHGFDTKGWTDIILPKIKGWAAIFCAHTQIKEYSDILKDHGFVAVGVLAWHKTNPVPFNHRFKLLSAFESAVVGKRPSTKFNGKSVHNVFTYKSPSPAQRIHPTQKPLPLIEELIRLFTDESDTVLDPFAGSATTLLASLNLNRKCTAFENDRKYYNLAVDKIKNYVLTF